MTPSPLRAATLAIALLALPCCVTVRSTLDRHAADHPVLLGPVPAIGAPPGPAAVPPAGEPIVVKTRRTTGAVMATFGSPRWDGSSTSTEHLDRIKLRPDAPVRVHHYGCYAVAILGILFYHHEVWCTVEADVAPTPATSPDHNDGGP